MSSSETTNMPVRGTYVTHADQDETGSCTPGTYVTSSRSTRETRRPSGQFAGRARTIEPRPGRYVTA